MRAVKKIMRLVIKIGKLIDKRCNISKRNL